MSFNSLRKSPKEHCEGETKKEDFRREESTNVSSDRHSDTRTIRSHSRCRKIKTVHRNFAIVDQSTTDERH